MGTVTLIWLIILTIGLIAHMIKDSKEFEKIQQLQNEIESLKQEQ